MEKTPKSRGHFTSSLGFILATAGSAIGLGNLWKFPYVAGSSGGGTFVIFYIIFTIILGLPLMMAEMSIGRKCQLNPIGAYQKLNKKWTFVGILGVFSSFLILSYYSVIGGWVIKYFVEMLVGSDFGGDTTAYFQNFISSPVEPIVYHLIFMVITAIIVIGGVSKGIEKVSKIMLPALLILVILVAIRSVTLPNASEGLKFFLMPTFDNIHSIKDLGNELVLAMGQVFFSLSIGTGIAITYGSYLKKNSDIVKNSSIVVTLDTIIAVLCGIAILPAVFSLGMKPSAGPGLLFQTLPAVFESIPFGRFVGILFFILVFFAAVTSSISMLEVVCAYLIDNFGISRKKAAITMSLIMAAIGTIASLSFGPLGDMKIFGMTFFDLLSFCSDKILMPLVGFLTCIFVGHIYGSDKLADEFNPEGGKPRIFLRKAFAISMKFVAPAFILVIFVMGLFE
ncbi:MAG: sodium-dependent transporter [Oscillospiraceae bacterium]